MEFDLSSFIDMPQQYEVVFNQTAGENELESKSVVLVLDDIEIPGFAEVLDKPNTFNVNITATPSRKKDSIRFKVVLKGKGGTDSSGNVTITKVKIF